MKLIDILYEQEWGKDIHYGSEKLDEYLSKGINNVLRAKKEYNKLLLMIKSLTINNVINQTGKYEGTLSQMESIQNAIKKIYGQYMKVITSYSGQEMPESVTGLESVAKELNEYIRKYGDLVMVLESMINASKKLPNEELTTVQQPSV